MIFSDDLGGEDVAFYNCKIFLWIHLLRSSHLQNKGLLHRIELLRWTPNLRVPWKYTVPFFPNSRLQDFKYDKYKRVVPIIPQRSPCGPAAGQASPPAARRSRSTPSCRPTPRPTSTPVSPVPPSTAIFILSVILYYQLRKDLFWPIQLLSKKSSIR